jgi:hypothetical protein
MSEYFDYVLLGEWTWYVVSVRTSDRYINRADSQLFIELLLDIQKQVKNLCAILLEINSYNFERNNPTKFLSPDLTRKPCRLKLLQLQRLRLTFWHNNTNRKMTFAHGNLIN